MCTFALYLFGAHSRKRAWKLSETAGRPTGPVLWHVDDVVDDKRRMSLHPEDDGSRAARVGVAVVKACLRSEAGHSGRNNYEFGYGTFRAVDRLKSTEVSVTLFGHAKTDEKRGEAA